MGYATIIDASLNIAFNQLKDLAVTITLKKKTVANFDFNAGEMPAGSTASTVIKAVIIDTIKESTTHNASKREILFKSKGVGDITTYDSFIIGTETWKFGPILSNNGYIILAEIFKEG